MARYVEQGAPDQHSPALDVYRELADHIAMCSVCASAVQAQRAVQTDIRGLMITVVPERALESPSEGAWPPLVAGGYAADEVLPLLEHASTCDYCGQHLQEITSSVGSHRSDELRSLVSRLASSGDEWQAELARKLTLHANAGARSVQRV